MKFKCVTVGLLLASLTVARGDAWYSLSFPLIDVTSNGSQVSALVAPANPGGPLRFLHGAPGHYFAADLDGTSLTPHNMTSGPEYPRFWTTSYDGIQTELRQYSFDWATPRYRLAFFVPGEVSDVKMNWNAGRCVSAWLTQGHYPQLWTVHESTASYSSTRLAQAAPDAIKVEDVQVMQSGVSFITTQLRDGSLDYRSLFSQGGTRWSRIFPRGTKLKIDRSGFSYAALETGSGIVVQRYDFFGSQVGEVTLPEKVGDRVLEMGADPSSYYLFLVSSRLQNARRVATVVRVSPTLSVQSQELRSFLATGRPVQVLFNGVGETYVIRQTTEGGKLSQSFTAYDSKPFQVLWEGGRGLAADDDVGRAVLSAEGVVLWGNQPSADGKNGYLIFLKETGFGSIYVRTGNHGDIKNGGGEGYLNVWCYGTSNVDRFFSLNSSTPDVTMPETIIIRAGASFATIPIKIAQSNMRRLIRFDAEELDLHVKRTFSVVIEPWKEPGLYSVAFKPNIVKGGVKARLRLNLTADGKGWTWLYLSSSKAGGVIVPSATKLPPGQAVDVYLDTLPVSARVVRKLDVRVGNSTKTDYLTIDP